MYYVLCLYCPQAMFNTISEYTILMLCFSQKSLKIIHAQKKGRFAYEKIWSIHSAHNRISPCHEELLVSCFNPLALTYYIESIQLHMQQCPYSKFSTFLGLLLKLKLVFLVSTNFLMRLVSKTQ
jgi:hypothetical protein